jgi:hypothetical protein
VSLCRTLEQIALRTWGLLSQGRSNSIQLGEETLTDLNLLALKAEHSHEVRTHVFHKHAERKTGADWEWWFTGQSGNWFGLRVQAKVLDFRSNCFKHLHYGPRHSRKSQCDNLIESCAATNPSPVPAYCFYSQWQPGTVGTDLLTLGGACAIELYGCALATAGVVLALRGGRGRAKRSELDHVIPYAMPWHLLVCQKENATGDLPTRACAAWKEEANAREQSLLNSLDERRRNELRWKIQARELVRVWDAPPDYVRAVENNVEPDSPPPVQRIIIVRQRAT